MPRYYTQTFQNMKTDHVGRIIFEEVDLVDMVMRGQPLADLNGLIVQPMIDLSTAAEILEDVPMFINYDKLAQESLEQFDHRCRNTWFMPDEYKQLDIAELVISKCTTPEQLQRCGEELLLYQERDLFDLLRYLVYLVDVMKNNNVIWGVGRGSSVASYVLYLLGVHRIDSMFYDLDVREFLR
jgi:DNA polymerase III alpha subunit